MNPLSILKKKQNRFWPKIIPLLAFFLLTASAVLAQDRAAPDLTREERARSLTDMQNERLAFSGEQEDRMYAINLKYFEEMERIVAAGRSISTMMKLRDMSGRKDKEVKKVLDKDQYKTYKRMKEDMREHVKARTKE